MNKLGAFYTTKVFSKLLINSITVKNPVLDLGIGEGVLFEKWNYTKYFGVDVNIEQLHKASKKMSVVEIIQG